MTGAIFPTWHAPAAPGLALATADGRYDAARARAEAWSSQHTDPAGTAGTTKEHTA